MDTGKKGIKLPEEIGELINLLRIVKTETRFQNLNHFYRCLLYTSTY